MQQVEDGTIRFQAKGEFNLSIEEVEKYVTNPELEMQFWQKNDINLQLVELFNENFWIVREFWDRNVEIFVKKNKFIMRGTHEKKNYFSQIFCVFLLFEYL
jgi:hypothetical protein